MKPFSLTANGAVKCLAALLVFALWPADGRATGQEQPERKWISLPAKCFVMGEDAVYPEEGPKREVCVDAFEITETEITNAGFLEFVEATGYVTRAERGWRADEKRGPGVAIPPGSAVFIPPTKKAANLSWWKLVEGANWRRPAGPDSDYEPAPSMPVVHVTREDAQAYAAWIGARLPTEAEWEYAARGGLEAALFAWEQKNDQSHATRANTWQGIFPVINTEDDGFIGLAPVKRFPPNGFGLHDMIGNVWEWTSTPYAPSHQNAAIAHAGPNGFDPAQPGVAVGVIKGGSYLCAPNYCFRFRPAARQAQDLAFGTSHIGFRVVRPIEYDKR